MSDERRPNRKASGFAIVCFLLMCSAVSPARAQKLFDDHELRDRFYITIGGFGQTEMRTTVRVDAKTPQGGLAAGAVIVLESLFSVEDSVETGRIDGWYRLNRKSRLGWTYFRTKRDGTSIYESDPITIGDITISPGDFVMVEAKSTLFAVSYSYSFVNLERFEAWLGGGLNFQSVDTTVTANIGGQGAELEEEAKATLPIPVFNFGMRYNFTKRIRMLGSQELFGVRVGDYSGRLSNSRILAEFDLTRHFGIGGGIERYNLEADVETTDFNGSFDSSYTGFSLYLKGQI